jgi:hypothetical protein
MGELLLDEFRILKTFSTGDGRRLFCSFGGAG